MCLSPRPSALLKPSIRANCHGVSHLLGAVTWQDGPWEPSCPKIQAVQHWLLTKARCYHKGCLLGVELKDSLICLMWQQCDLLAWNVLEKVKPRVKKLCLLLLQVG